MPLKGVAKTNYQRNYMRERRLRGRLLDLAVRPPPEAKNQHPYGYPGMIGVDAEGNPIYED